MPTTDTIENWVANAFGELTSLGEELHEKGGGHRISSTAVSRPSARAGALTTERMYILQSIMTAVPLMELFETRGH